MPFFARPNLDDTQFKQLSGSTLTLSGTTRIATVGGLVLTDEYQTPIPVVITGATDQDVLTYINGELVLSSPSSGTSTGVYICKSPTTCTVGGLSGGTDICNWKIDTILEAILAPTLNPTLSPNSISMSLSPTTLIFELGCSIGFTSTITYNRGSVNPVYCSGTPYRTGAVTCYAYTNINGFTYSGVSSSCVLPAASIALGPNTVYGATSYAAGVAPKKSDGTSMTGVTCPAGTISTSKTVNGVLPYFWGKSTTVPITKTCVANGNKVVACANGVLPICFNSTASDYLWLAVPSSTPAKTCWYVNGTNNGAISGIAGQTWAQACTVTGVTSISGCWSNRTYSVYVTCLQTGTDPNVPMCFY